MMDLDEEIEILDYDIRELAERHDSMLRAPWEGRVAHEARWHRVQASMWRRLRELRELRKALIAEQKRSEA